MITTSPNPKLCCCILILNSLISSLHAKCEQNHSTSTFSGKMIFHVAAKPGLAPPAPIWNLAPQPAIARNALSVQQLLPVEILLVRPMCVCNGA